MDKEKNYIIDTKFKQYEILPLHAIRLDISSNGSESTEIEIDMNYLSKDYGEKLLEHFEGVFSGNVFKTKYIIDMFIGNVYGDDTIIQLVNGILTERKWDINAELNLCTFSFDRYTISPATPVELLEVIRAYKLKTLLQ